MMALAARRELAGGVRQHPGSTTALRAGSTTALRDGPGCLPPDFPPGLATPVVYHAEGEAWSSGCCVAGVAIDAEDWKLTNREAGLDR